MGKKLVSKTAKVLSETKKSKDKEAVAIAYEHIPRSPEEQSHGSLYAVLSIEDSSGHAEEIAEGIIDALHNEYYLDTEREPLASFESALAKINEELGERSSEGQINWLGKLNGVLAVLTGSTIHLTQAGKAEAYLYRGEHTMHITEDLAGDSINPLRTFINIASGDLVENDRLAIVTPSVFLKISKSELKRFATEGSPKMAVESLSQVLSSETGATLPNALLLMQMLSPEAFAAEPEPEAPAEAWVKQDSKPMEQVGEQTIQGAAKTFDVLGKAAAGATAFVSAKLIPGVKSGANKLTNSVKNFRKEPTAEKIILESEEKLDHHPQPKAETEYEDDGILETGEKSDNYSEIRIKEAEERPKRLSLERFDFSWANKAKDAFGRGAKNLKGPGSKRSGLYLIGAIVLVLLLVGGLVYSNNVKKQKASAEALQTQAQQKYDDATTALASGSRSDAIEDLNSAESLAKQAQATTYQKVAATALLSKIDTAKEQAQGVVRNTAKEYFDFGKGELNAIYQDGTTIYAVKYSDGSVYALDTSTKKSTTIISAAGIPAPIKFSAYISARKTIAAVTTDNNLYELSISTKKAIKQTVSGGLAEGVGLGTYGSSNIYLLSPANNQIYKYVKSGTSYGTKTNYLASGADVTGDDAIAIDSSVYVTTPGGTIQKFTSGKSDDYSVKDYPGSFSKINIIFADANVKGQYLANKDTIIKIDSNQAFTAQYKSDDVKNISSIFADDKTNQIYALSGGKVYTIAF